MTDNNEDTKPERIITQRAVIEHGQVVDADSPEAAAWATEQIQKSRARAERRREVWGDDNVDQIVRLARSFPTLRRADGLDPWDTVRFLSWATSPACTSGGWHAAMFVLSVWNQTTDWAAVARAEGLLADPARVDDPATEAAELGLVVAGDNADANIVAPELVDRAAAAVRTARSFSFSVSRAFGVWDEPHQRAFLAWCQLPFFP